MTKEQLNNRVNVVKDVMLEVMKDGATFNAADVTNLFVLGLNMAQDEEDMQHYCRLEWDPVLRKMYQRMERLEK